jgi:hypothetical protein
MLIMVSPPGSDARRRVAERDPPRPAVVTEPRRRT